MHTTQIGVDLAKSVFELAVSTAPGHVEDRRRVSRAGFPRFVVNRPPAQVMLEACGTAHHWARTLQRLGHEVTLLHPADVARYRDGIKTDRADAKALLEAVLAVQPTQAVVSAGAAAFAPSGRRRSTSRWSSAASVRGRRPSRRAAMAARQVTVASQSRKGEDRRS